MYRPNRVGPHGLMDLNSVLRDLGDGEYEDGLMTTVPRGLSDKNEGNIATNAKQFRSQFDIAANALSHGAIGVKLVGTDLFEGRQYLLEYAGNFSAFTIGESISVRPIIGRIGVEGNSNFSVSQPWFPPMGTSQHIATSGVARSPIVASCQGTVVMGDWEPSGNIDVRTIFGGWCISNGENQTINVEHMWCSFSLHRYEGDLTPFDPNR